MVNTDGMKKTINITPEQAASILQEAQNERDMVAKTVAPILEYDDLPRCSHMNYGNPPKKIYKYLSIDSAKLCIEKGNIRFSQPSAWKDGFERRFYSGNCDYSRIVSTNDQQIYTPRLYACCFTQNITSEAAWKVYSYDNDTVCVQFTINVDKFRVMLSEIAERNNCMVYEGPMIYNYSDDEIVNLHKKDTNRHDILFNNFKLDNYLNLLRIKRKAFDYENEYRFFIIPQNQATVTDQYLYVPVAWDKVVEEIKIEENNNEQTKDSFKNFLKTNAINIELQEFDLNKMDEKIVIEK